MSAETKQESRLQIGHVLFLDLVGYSKLLIDKQGELQEQLSQIVRNTKAFRIAEAEDKLVRLPSGDGMALVFFGDAEGPVRCAVEIAEASRSRADLRLRMGINSGPVSGVADVNDRSNVAGAGINVAQRVMDCGDAGHILLSKRVAEDLAQYARWRDHLHELGQAEVKHGVKLDVVNFYNNEVGNAELPAKFKQAAEGEKAKAHRLTVTRRRKQILIGAALLLAIASGLVFRLSSVDRLCQRLQLARSSTKASPFSHSRI